MPLSLSPTQTRRRLAVVVLLTLLPWPAVWLGMYRLDSLVWTFALYHGVCLLPAAVWGRRLWLRAIKAPTLPQWVVLGIAILVVMPVALLVYARIGASFLSPRDILHVVTLRGFQARWLWPLGFYFVPVNAILEEMFWRGVVLNELRGMDETSWALGAAWTTLTFAGWHYLVIRLLLRHGWAEVTVLGIVAAGVFLAWMYRRTRSLVLPILWHGLVFDLMLIIVFGAVLHAK